MQRIYYGQITIDVSDQLATAVKIYASIVGAGHTTVPREITGYLNGGDNQYVVSLLLGEGIPLAVAPQFPAKPEPSANHEEAKKFLEDAIKVADELGIDFSK